ncbi:MAG: hypothetical protein R2729_06070 [Bryobacteraceae bacterium]
MTHADVSLAADLFAGGVSSIAHAVGGLEFYGYSAEFRDLITLCRDFTLAESREVGVAKKAYVFLPDAHGKTSLAKAMVVQASSNGVKAFRFDGTAGATAKELKDLQMQQGVLIVVDGLPESSQPRSLLLERFNSLKGDGVLFAEPEYASDASLKPDITWISLPHVDERYPDKVAWIVGLLLELLRDEAGVVPDDCINAVQSLANSAFMTLCRPRLGEKISNIRDLAEKIAQAIQLTLGLGSAPSISDEVLASLFVEFHSSGIPRSPAGFRLWVEGESDSRLLYLVCQLALPAHGIDLGQGLTIIPLGSGRDGGTSKATEIVVNQRTKRNRDVFLLDYDDPGRHTRQELETLDQDVLLLDVKLACSRMDDDVEIEDLINVGCLDRFYADHPSLRPEREIIRYKAPMSRRLVVNGVDKETLIEWLERNARLEDLENVMFMLCEARSRFSLKNLPAMKDKQGWKKRLTEEVNQDKCLGKRSDQWDSY